MAILSARNAKKIASALHKAGLISARSAKRLQRKLLPKRKPIAITGDHAEAKEITKKRHPLKGTIQRTFREPWPSIPHHNLAHTLAHLFFPRNFAKPVAASIDRRSTYFRRAKISPQSQKAIDSYYKSGLIGQKLARYEEHEKKVKEAVKIIQFKKAGIIVNRYPMNVGFRSGVPVYFEVLGINVKKAEKFARKIRDPLMRRQALEIIEGLKAQIPWKFWRNYFEVHSYSLAHAGLPGIRHYGE